MLQTNAASSSQGKALFLADARQRHSKLPKLPLTLRQSLLNSYCTRTAQASPLAQAGGEDHADENEDDDDELLIKRDEVEEEDGELTIQAERSLNLLMDYGGDRGEFLEDHHQMGFSSEEPQLYFGYHVLNCQHLRLF